METITHFAVAKKKACPDGLFGRRNPKSQKSRKFKYLRRMAIKMYFTEDQYASGVVKVFITNDKYASGVVKVFPVRDKYANGVIKGYITTDRYANGVMKVFICSSQYD